MPELCTTRASGSIRPPLSDSRTVVVPLPLLPEIARSTTGEGVGPAPGMRTLRSTLPEPGAMSASVRPPSAIAATVPLGPWPRASGRPPTVICVGVASALERSSDITRLVPGSAAKSRRGVPATQTEAGVTPVEIVRVTRVRERSTTATPRVTGT
jgi:hypothetical protein